MDTDGVLVANDNLVWILDAAGLPVVHAVTRGMCLIILVVVASITVVMMVTEGVEIVNAASTVVPTNKTTIPTPTTRLIRPSWDTNSRMERVTCGGGYYW